MLTKLNIKNIALIDSLSVDLSEGLNVLTGETGAGKSIIIDSLSLVLGERADREIIKYGTEKASVEAFFENIPQDAQKKLEALGIEMQQELVLSREITVSGRNICRINGTLVNNSALREISSLIIDIHGQHEHQSLFNTASHIVLLDKYANNSALLKKVEQDYNNLRQVEEKLNELGVSDGERERRLDLLKYQINELKEAELKGAEYEELKSKRQVLLNAEKIAGALEQAFSDLSGSDTKGAMPLVHSALREIQRISALSEKYSSIEQRIEEAYYLLEALADEIRSFKNELEYDGDHLEAIEKRLDTITRITRKYGGTVENALGYLNKCIAELNEIENAEQTIEQLNQKRRQLIGDLYNSSLELSESRRKHALELEKEVLRELNELGMNRSGFHVQFNDIPKLEQFLDNTDLFSKKGFDKAEFLFSANLGEPLRPLARIASGGEASRIMLAFKNISASLDEINCMIFDEIDTGISGAMAYTVADKLARISRERQVICITHLAQIACMADTHYLIEKHEIGNSTYTKVERLNKERRVLEVARLIGVQGQSDHGIAHAQEMINNSEEKKKQLKQQVKY